MLEAVLGTLAWLIPALALGWLLRRQRAVWPLGVLALFWGWLLVVPAGFLKLGAAWLSMAWGLAESVWVQAFVSAALIEESLRWGLVTAWRLRRPFGLPLGLTAAVWWTFAGAEGLFRGLGAEGWSWGGFSPLVLHGLLGVLAETSLQDRRPSPLVWLELIVWHGSHNALVLASLPGGPGVGLPGGAWLVNALLLLRVLLARPWRLGLQLQADRAPAA